ncbi:MAG TPA: hypothetical protein P5341_08930 [Hyphomonas sp.]|nr:hypothetical protein [Hyphomonas sp.]
MTGNRIPPHLGGPLGLAGLALLAGATGIFVMAGSDDPAPAPLPSSHETALAVTDPRPGEAPLPAPHDSALPMAQPAELPASAQTSAPAQIRLAQANTDSAEVIFIVRIKGEPEIDVISRNYKRDPAAAEIAWANLQSRYAVLKDFRLVGASYSGEIKLGYSLPPGLEPTRATINEIQSRILQVESVSYADPDYVAQAGKE